MFLLYLALILKFSSNKLIFTTKGTRKQYHHPLGIKLGKINKLTPIEFASTNFSFTS